MRRKSLAYFGMFAVGDDGVDVVADDADDVVPGYYAVDGCDSHNFDPFEASSQGKRVVRSQYRCL